MIRSYYEIIQVKADQGKNRRENAVCKGVNEHFEPILNAVMR